MKSMSRHLVAILLASSLVAIPSAVMAHGLGVAMEGGIGRLKTTEHPIFSGTSRDFSYGEDREGIGIVYDTNVGRDAIFNYRLGLIYQNMNARDGESRLDMDGLTVENDFGFSLLRKKEVRLWAGPEVRVEYLEGHGSHDSGGYQESTFGLGLGPVLGLNYNLPNGLSVTFRGGYLFQYGMKIFTDWDERYGFFSLGLLMRLGEGALPGK